MNQSKVARSKRNLRLLITYDGTAHGSDILTAQPKSATDITTWLTNNFNA